MSNHQQNLFQLTFVKKSSNNRPKTSSLHNQRRNSFRIQKKYNQNDPWIKMKELKAQAKQTQQKYIQMLRNLKQTEKVINQNYKEVQKRKVSFLKLYETKKMKNLLIEGQKQCKTQREERNNQTRQQVRRFKIEEQLKRLLTRQQKQIYLQKLRKQLQKQKEKFRNKKHLKQNEIFNNSRNSFLSIKKSHDQSKQRKSQIKSVNDVRSKHFYWKKVSEQIQILEEYQKIIKELQEFQNLQAQMEGRAQTSQTGRSSKTGFFLTDKR